MCAGSSSGTPVASRVQGVSGTAVAATAAGGLLLWSGIKGAGISQSFRSLLSGQKPVPTGANPIQGTVGGSDASAGATGILGVSTGPPSPAGHYSHAQLVSLWISAGGSAASANNAACHALQESSGDPAATSSNPDGGTNVGLWQLDTRGKGAGYSVAQLQNAMTNARITVLATRNGSDWSAWATPGC